MDKNILVSKAIFVEKDVIQNNKKEKGFSKKIKKSVFFEKKKGFQKTNSKNDERTSVLFRCQITEIQKIYSWKGFNRCFGVKKKVKLSCLKEQD